MKLGHLISVMEKCGSISFETQSEREGFTKIAQGMAMDPAMMQQMAMQSGMQPMADPAMANPAQMNPMMDPAVAQMQAAGAVDPSMGGAADPSMGGVVQPMTAEEAMVGEGITNSDIESLVKVINIITSLKGKYDGMKKEQMALIKAQTEGMPEGEVIPPGA